MKMTEERKLVLRKGIENNAKISTDLASKVYSDRTQAKSTLKTLESNGFIERIAPGRFKVKKIPKSLEGQVNL
jgi:predicted transcriptional regulator of viral defense system